MARNTVTCYVHSGLPAYCCALQVPSSNKDQSDQLLQLPAPALNCVLQKLDPCSLANSAITCSKLTRAVPASITQAVVRCKTQQKLDSFKLWLQQHDSSIAECWIVDEARHMWRP